MYITSSTAEIMNGPFPSNGFEGLRVRPDGDSSSWNAFSTERRKKKVVIMLKGVISRPDIFLDKADLTSNSGITSGSSGLAAGSWEILEMACSKTACCGLTRHFPPRNREYSDHRPNMTAISLSSPSTSLMSTPSSSLSLPLVPPPTAGELVFDIPKD